MGENTVPELSRREGRGSSTAASGAPGAEKVANDPVLAHARQLAAAGLEVEAGWDLQRDEKTFLQRWGESRGLPILLDRYPDVKAFRRAYELGESRNGGALAAAPT